MKDCHLPRPRNPMFFRSSRLIGRSVDLRARRRPVGQPTGQTWSVPKSMWRIPMSYWCRSMCPLGLETGQLRLETSMGGLRKAAECVVAPFQFQVNQLYQHPPTGHHMQLLRLQKPPFRRPVGRCMKVLVLGCGLANLCTKSRRKVVHVPNTSSGVPRFCLGRGEGFAFLHKTNQNDPFSAHMLHSWTI